MLVPSKISRIFVSHHAAIRVVQRLRLFMTAKEQANPKSFIASQFKQGMPDRRWETSPFISNRRNKSFRVVTEMLELRGRHCEDGGVVITTVIANTKNITEKLNEKSE